MTKARSALAHKTGLKLDPLNNCLLFDGLKFSNWYETSLDVDFLLKCRKGFKILVTRISYGCSH